MEDAMTETCPVCGWAVLRVEHIPENIEKEDA
jgi:hypothetical protein